MNYEQAKELLELHKQKYNPSYITLRPNWFKGDSSKPFCSANSHTYVGYYATTEEAYKAVKEKLDAERSARKIKTTNDMVRMNKFTDEPQLNRFDKLIRSGNYEAAMKIAERRNDKNLIAFMNRLKAQKVV